MFRAMKFLGPISFRSDSIPSNSKVSGTAGINTPKYWESSQTGLRFIILERKQLTLSSPGVPRAQVSPSMSLVVPSSRQGHIKEI